MARLLFAVALLLTPGEAFQVAPRLASKPAASVRTSAVAMEAPGDKAVAIGAAATGGILGVYLTGELSTGVLFAAVFAYGTTLSNSFGSATKTAGSTAAKVYSKTLEINEQYDVLPKTKSALDTVTTAAANLDANYGVTASIDEKLKLSATVEKATSKVDDLKSSLTAKADDLKAKASATE